MKATNLVSFFDEGTIPIDGSDPKVYSKVVPFHPFSFLRTNISSTISPEESKYLPSVSPPTYLSEKELYSKQYTKKEEIFKASSVVVDKEYGGVKLTDEGTIKEHRSIFAEVLKKIGKSLFNSNIVGMSLPIRIMEPRSDLDRFCEMFRIMGFYLRKAASHPDKLERLKLVTAARVASNYIMMRKKKTMNPLLGETLQASLADGTQIYAEQISHHPPISYVYVVGPGKCYTLYGPIEAVPSFKGNYLLISLNSNMTIKFRDGHCIEGPTRPALKITGLIMGDQRVFLKGPLILEDRTLKVRSVVFFDYGEKKGFISSKKTATRDAVEGAIYVPKPVSINETARRVSDLDDIKKEVARIQGSWLEKVEINSVNYWHIDKLFPERVIYSGNPLPSDWRFREDLIWHRRGDTDTADAWKDALEIRQRRDRALREKFAKA